MKLVFLIFCLSVVLGTVGGLIIRGFHTYSHRLLPLVLGLFALYDFYLIVEYLTGEKEVFSILKELLMLQVVDVVLFYVLDFLKIKWSNLTKRIVAVLILLLDIIVIVQISNPEIEHNLIPYIVVAAMFFIAGLAFFSAKKKLYSKQTKRNNVHMFAALWIPMLTLILSIFRIVDETIFMPLSLALSCMIIGYLFYTDKLRDVDSILKEEHFQTLDMPAFLFDQDMFYIDASQKARELFPVHIKMIEKKPASFVEENTLRALVAQNGVAHRKINDRYYKLTLQDAYYNGKMKGYILSFFDITEQKKETNMAMELAKQKSEFLASISHDLRSPLHAIIGSSEIVLSRSGISDRNVSMINHIHDAGANLLDLVNSILDFSKLESGGLKLYDAKYNFKTLIKEQAQIGYTNLKTKPVKLIIEVNDPFPEFLYGDELRIRQIVQNLLSNAIKFTDKGTIRCSFHISIENDEMVRIHYTVSDTGVGMTQEQTKTVFGDYVTYAGDQKKEGTGLGLSIVRKLAELMGGYAKAESDGETGSTVSVEFFQKLTEEDVASMKETGLQLQNVMVITDENQLGNGNIWKNTEQPTYVYPTAKVLLADDMLVNREIFKEITAPWKFTVDTAKDGQEAVKLAIGNQYDLIVLDQMMPVMTGTEAADELKKFTKAPMILLTADITDSMREESKRHGFHAFMKKPIDLALLKELIETLLPENLRRQSDAYESETMLRNRAVLGYEKALRSYISELKDLSTVLPTYAKTDLSMFRNKVHGIKGVSKQLGKENIASYAEILEMAATLDNQAFVDKNIDIFMGDLQFVISDAERELEVLLEKKTETEITISRKREVSNDEVKDLFEGLKTSLEQYDMTEIEDYLMKIEEIVLPRKTTELVYAIKELYDDVEYDEALELVNQILEKY